MKSSKIKIKTRKKNRLHVAKLAGHKAKLNCQRSRKRSSKGFLLRKNKKKIQKTDLLLMKLKRKSLKIARK